MKALKSSTYSRDTADLPSVTDTFFDNPILRTITTDFHFTLSVAVGDVDGDARFYLDYPCQDASGVSHYMLRGVSGEKRVM